MSIQVKGIGNSPNLQTKTINPSYVTQQFVPDSNYEGFSTITINPYTSNIKQSYSGWSNTTIETTQENSRIIVNCSSSITIPSPRGNYYTILLFLIIGNSYFSLQLEYSLINFYKFSTQTHAYVLIEDKQNNTEIVNNSDVTYNTIYGRTLNDVLNGATDKYEFNFYINNSLSFYNTVKTHLSDLSVKSRYINFWLTTDAT